MNWHVLEQNWRELVQIRKPKKKKKKKLWCSTNTLATALVPPRVKGTYYKQSFSIYYKTKEKRRRSIYVKLAYWLLHFSIRIINNSYKSMKRKRATPNGHKIENEAQLTSCGYMNPDIWGFLFFSFIPVHFPWECCTCRVDMLHSSDPSWARPCLIVRFSFSNPLFTSLRVC